MAERQRTAQHGQIEQGTDHRPRARRASERRVVPVQAKLVVGAAADPHEAEADRVAREVMRRLAQPTPDAATTPVTGEPGQTGGAVRREADPASAAGGPLDGATEGRIRSASGGGAALDGTVRERMERGFGADFGRVRVHTGSHAADLNRQVGAKAFTAGNDIFFGAGEYRPETASGQQLLAHELTHTIQQGGGSHRVTRLRRSTADPLRVSAAPRTVQRWAVFDRDNPQPPDWDDVKGLRTITSGQPVLFVDDHENDTIVVKAEDAPIGATLLAAGMHRDLGGSAVVRTRDASSHKATIMGMIADPALTSHSSWARLGTENKHAAKAQGATPEEKGRNFMLDSFGRQHLAKVQIMQLAPGESARAITNRDQFKGEDAKQGHPLRHWLKDDNYLYQLGRITAVDLFMENADRVYFQNLGNWMTSPMTGDITLIDNLDAEAKGMFMNPSLNIEQDGNLIKKLAKNQLRPTAEHCADMVLRGMKYEGDPKAEAWGKQPYQGNVTNRDHIAAGILLGLKDGRAKMIRRFASSKMSAKGREAKRAAQSARQMDLAAGDDGGVDYWEILKARGRWLQKH